MEANLEQLNAELARTNTFIAITTKEVEALEQTIANLEAQLNILNGKEAQIREAREADELAYNVRVIWCYWRSEGSRCRREC